MDLKSVAVSHRTHLPASHPARTWTLALLQGTSAAGLAAIAAVPLGGSAPTHLYVACAGALVAVVAVLLLVPARLGDRSLLTFAGVRVAVVALTLAAANSPGATLFAGAGLVWVLVWATGFFPARTVKLIFLAELLTAALGAAVNQHHLRTGVYVLPLLAGAVVLSLLLSRVLGSLRHEARHDELTGLLNRRGLDQAMRELAVSRRFSGSVSSLVAIDLDGLKLVNDHAGHLAGDEMLVTFATEMQTAARGVDLTARVGGDEFIAILPGRSEADATEWARQLHASSGVAWSYGVAERSEGEALELWLSRADKLMYASKEASRAARPPRGAEAVAGPGPRRLDAASVRA